MLDGDDENISKEEARLMRMMMKKTPRSADVTDLFGSQDPVYGRKKVTQADIDANKEKYGKLEYDAETNQVVLAGVYTVAL